ncbi:nuclear transcription factor Y subunit C-7, putative [Entamoeba invadens IP1]|uniref:Nuclear transcription factor Y subunit C-7, putative n=1 Tax=Entamoeba invadens IP1 TaxID=370355 RepID=A0A0A1UAN7_ENTIV|nr:nuclear transcription factor Y subunit C-7, putative [Entamoeba invadens IP1]ELP92122.1 nuclear transcription factor Y subunit C-7, putative [Entamoeba invadens IP1]|eukprot:XP_004258893.1 nuclear transcription factor Y subunit C-7, putative [Entamoeba invadens IP1]
MQSPSKTPLSPPFLKDEQLDQSTLLEKDNYYDPHSRSQSVQYQMVQNCGLPRESDSMITPYNSYNMYQPQEPKRDDSQLFSYIVDPKARMPPSQNWYINPTPLDQKVKPKVRCVGEDFWQKRMSESEKRDFKKKPFPPARIRKLMKIATDKKHVKTETVELLSRACELFIMDLTTRASVVTSEAKRKVIKKEDIVESITGDEQFDFLFDLLPKT